MITGSARIHLGKEGVELRVIGVRVENLRKRLLEFGGGQQACLAPQGAMGRRQSGQKGARVCGGSRGRRPVVLEEVHELMEVVKLELLLYALPRSLHVTAASNNALAARKHPTYY